MKIESVAIIGAGAIGAYFIWGLEEKYKDKLYIIADGKRAERLKSEGIVINGQKHALNVKTAKEAAKEGVDLLLISTKYGSLKGTLEDIKTIVGENTIVMSLLNGVDSEDIIAEEIGYDRIMYSLMRIASRRTNEGVTFDPEKTMGLYFGESRTYSGEYPSERMRCIADAMDNTDIKYTMNEDMIKDMWVKYAQNVSDNQTQAMIGCGVGAYVDSEYVAHIRKGLRHEAVLVAAAKGIDISASDNPTTIAKTSTKATRYSTLQDIDAKRLTEVDMFAGTMIRMGKELGIPTPFNEVTYNIIKALEEKNNGKFDY